MSNLSAGGPPRAFAISILALGLGFANLCAAQGYGNGSDKAVRYTQRDLATPEAAQALHHRLEVAADEVCAWLDRGDLVSRQMRMGCAEKSLERAVRQINQPALNAVHFPRRDTPAAQVAERR